MREVLKDQLLKRMKAEIAPQSPLKFLLTTDIEEYLDIVISVVYLYTRPKKGDRNLSVYMVEIASAIGHSVRNRLKLKQDSSVAVKLGAFILYTFQQLGVIEVVLGRGNKHASYIVKILDDELICDLWANLDPTKVEKLPAETPYAPWEAARHSTGAWLVKTNNKGVLNALTPETHPIIFNCVNKAQVQGWRIHEELFRVHTWALRNKTAAFADIWDQPNLEARTTKLREARAIGSIAERFLEKTFYHLYYYDFRGRKYPTTAYLHEQGSDLARGLLLRDDKSRIGRDGFFWLCVSIASNWAGSSGREDGLKTDKIPLKERYEWVLDNEEIILSYAESPKVHQGWMQADKPWQFLAACLELKNLRIWQAIQDKGYDNYDYESHLEVYIDGSNNGSQHLSALTRDEITAPHVNLVPQELPGDLYKYVADHVWERIRTHVEGMDKRIVAKCNRFIDTLIDLKRQINEAQPKSEVRANLVEIIKAFKEEEAGIAKLASPVFWLRVNDQKQRRKVVKRNVMTLPYGGTSYGLGQQQIDDSKKHGIELLLSMEHKWGSYLGREVYEDCRVSLERPMRLLAVFEAAGKAAEERGEFLSWTVPVTGFPVVQHYTEGVTKRVYVQYGPPVGERTSTGYYENTLQLHVCFLENMVPSKGKQSSGASPNAIHSLDAAHLAMTVDRADFSVTTIHDSFGCLLADMPKLYQLIRETFVDLYRVNPLFGLMEDIQGDISGLEFGTLDIEAVLESAYAFV
jgi:DNA-directed RNA polymerase